MAFASKDPCPQLEHESVVYFNGEHHFNPLQHMGETYTRPAMDDVRTMKGDLVYLCKSCRFVQVPKINLSDAIDVVDA